MKHLTYLLINMTLMAVPLLGFATESTAANSLFNATSGESQTSLIELFSSEGCSSCPPADQWLSKLKASPRLWKEFVPLSFHVDYWDNLGWVDRWARPEFTERQRNHSRAWGSRTVYTPGFVLDGAEWGSWGGGIPAGSTTIAGVLQLMETAPGKFSVNFPSGNSAKDLKVHFASLGCDIVSKVAAGENGGRTLLHDFVVLNHGTTSLKSGKATFELEHPSRSVAPRAGIAVWVTIAESEKPLQAVGGWW